MFSIVECSFNWVSIFFVYIFVLQLTLNIFISNRVLFFSINLHSIYFKYIIIYGISIVIFLTRLYFLLIAISLMMLRYSILKFLFSVTFIVDPNVTVNNFFVFLSLHFFFQISILRKQLISWITGSKPTILGSCLHWFLTLGTVAARSLCFAFWRNKTHL